MERKEWISLGETNIEMARKRVEEGGGARGGREGDGSPCTQITCNIEAKVLTTLYLQLCCAACTFHVLSSLSLSPRDACTAVVFPIFLFKKIGF